RRRPGSLEDRVARLDVRDVDARELSQDLVQHEVEEHLSYVPVALVVARQQAPQSVPHGRQAEMHGPDEIVQAATRAVVHDADVRLPLVYPEVVDEAPDLATSRLDVAPLPDRKQLQ
ncbi:hypothetical protein THAOC_22624, partial [Thalassiosira oceanica]